MVNGTRRSRVRIPPDALGRGMRVCGFGFGVALPQGIETVARRQRLVFLREAPRRRRSARPESARRPKDLAGRIMGLALAPRSRPEGGAAQILRSRASGCAGSGWRWRSLRKTTPARAPDEYDRRCARSSVAERFPCSTTTPARRADGVRLSTDNRVVAGSIPAGHTPVAGAICRIGRMVEGQSRSGETQESVMCP